MQIYIIHGPNMNLLGQREVALYGHNTLEDIEDLCRAESMNHGFSVCFFQSNYEGALVDIVQQACKDAGGLLINFAAYSHTSLALADALRIFPGPIVEVHITNLYKRETFRHMSYSGAAADAVFSGAGILGYKYGLDFLANRLRNKGKKPVNSVPCDNWTC